MNIRIRYISTALVMILGAQACAHAQRQPQTILVGGGAGVAFGFDSADLPVYSSNSECGTFESGSGIRGAVDGRLVLPMFFSSAVGLDSRLRLSIGSSRLTAEPVVPTVIRDAEGDALVTLDREFRIDRSTISVAVDLLARIAFDRIAVGIGASIGDRVSSTTEQTDNVLGPGANRFPNGQSSQMMSLDSRETAPISIAPMLTASYAIPVSERASIVPELALRFDLMSSVRVGSWRTVELGLGVALMFDLTPAATPIDAGPGGN